MLTNKELNEIKELQEICERYEDIQLKLNWDMLVNHNENLAKDDHFYYDDQKLVGFLGLYSFGDKVEICGMVHPDFRRKGIFTKLLQDALRDCGTRKLSSILLNAPANSDSAKAFLNHIDCSYSFSEHQMKWRKQEVHTVHEGVHIRPFSSEEDRIHSIRLDVECFAFSEQGAIEYHSRLSKDVTQQSFIIEEKGCIVGKIRIQRNGRESWIYGFAIYPLYQGQGIGRRALMQTVLSEYKAGYDVFLEVAVENKNALKLYEGCGFVPYHTQDYYVHNHTLLFKDC